MINKIAGIFLLFTLVACNGSNPGDQEITKDPNAKDNFTINGTIQNAQNLTFYLEVMLQEGPRVVSKIKADATGNFKLTGNIPGFGLYQLRMGESQDNIIPLTMVPKDVVAISATVDNFVYSPTLTGTSWSDAMTNYMKIYSDFHIAQAELMENKDALSNNELTKQFKLLKVPVDSFSIATMIADPGNPFNIVLSASATPTMGYNDWDPKNIEILNSVCNAFNQDYPNSVITTSLSRQTYQMETDYKQHMANTSGTLPAPEIALNNPSGVELKLSSLKGNYVLVDFWASWCGPCRRETPNVVRLYNKYKDRGFTVYSVSLDDNMDAWKAAIAQDGMTWPNHVSDLLKWNSTMPQLYGFSGIPHTVLLNREGNVIGVGLRGESLEQKLNEVFSN